MLYCCIPITGHWILESVGVDINNIDIDVDVDDDNDDDDNDDDDDAREIPNKHENFQ
jgi:uncharacterized OsmC-like protein